MKKPRLCEILGVEVDEEFKIEGWEDTCFWVNIDGFWRRHTSREMGGGGTLSDICNETIVPVWWTNFLQANTVDYYGGLHCGECFDVFTGGKWKPTRIEMGENWYLVGIRADDLNGLQVRI